MLNLKPHNPDHILTCISYCGKIDRLLCQRKDDHTPDENVLKRNAGFSVGLEANSRDEMIARGSLEWLKEFHNSPNTFSLSNTNIKSLHRKIFKFSPRDDGSRGRYRTDLDDEMKKLFEATKDSLASHERHPLFTISLFRVAFNNAMPFITGNSLCANLITYALLFNDEYSIVSQLPLLASLNNADSADPLSTLSKTFFELLSSTPTPPNPTLTPRTPPVLHSLGEGGNSDTYLNSRRKSLLKHITINAPLKISDIMNKFQDESRNTIKKDLLYLREKKMIVAQGQGRGMFYTVTSDKPVLRNS